MNTYEYSYNGVVGHTFTGTFAQFKKHVLEKAPANANKFLVRYSNGKQTSYAIERRVILSISKIPETCTNLRPFVECCPSNPRLMPINYQ